MMMMLQMSFLKLRNRRAGNTEFYKFFFSSAVCLLFGNPSKNAQFFHIICTPNCLSDAK